MFRIYHYSSKRCLQSAYWYGAEGNRRQVYKDHPQSWWLMVPYHSGAAAENHQS